MGSFDAARDPDLESAGTGGGSKKGGHAGLIRALQRDAKRDGASAGYTLLHECIAELLGVVFIVVFGVGSVCTAILTNYHAGLWDITVIWGLGVALAVAATGSVSGGHLNPAVSLAMALFRPGAFPARKLGPFWLAQYLGGVLGGALNLMVWGGTIRRFEAAEGITRGLAGSEKSAAMFGEYFPNPAFADKVSVSPGLALLVEAWGTGILMFVILAVTDPRQKLIRAKETVPLYIGFTVAALMTLYAPITMAGWNPARDFGPRIVAAMAGWGRIAIPGPRSGFWVYIIGPKIGAVVAALIYDVTINPGLTSV